MHSQSAGQLATYNDLRLDNEVQSILNKELSQFGPSKGNQSA